jgi:hypothetical protein
MIDYWLKSATSSPVTVEIVDAAGKVVRHFSSSDQPEAVNPKELNVPMYWVRPARTLSAAAGMHRFIWDLTYPEPEVLEHDYPISAIYQNTPRYPQGAAVLPGQYKIVLTASGKTYSQKLEIKMDPRVKTSTEDLRHQFELDRKIADALHRDYEALQQARSLRAQLKALATVPDAIKQAASAVDSKAANIAGEEGGYGARYLSTPEGRSLSRLNSGFSAMLSALDTADAAPTSQQVAMFGELNKALEEQLGAWLELKSKDIPQLNEQLKKAGLPAIDLQKPVSGETDSMQTTTQDRDRNEE